MTDFKNKDKIEEAAMKLLRVNMTAASITVEDLPGKYMGLWTAFMFLNPIRSRLKTRLGLILLRIQGHKTNRIDLSPETSRSAVFGNFFPEFLDDGIDTRESMQVRHMNDSVALVNQRQVQTTDDHP